MLMNQLKTIGKSFILYFVTLVYFEVLTYIKLNNTISGIGIYNILFLIPISFVLSGFVSWGKKTRNIESLIIILVLTIFYISQCIYYETFGSIYSISMLGVGNEAVTNFWWSVSVTIKENIGIILLYCLPFIFVLFDCVKTKIFVIEYKLWLHPVLIVFGIVCWLIVVATLLLLGTKDYTPYGVYHNKYVDVDTSSKKLGVITSNIIELKYMLLGTDRQELIIEEEVVEEIVKPVEEIVKYNINNRINFNSLIQETESEKVKSIAEYLQTVSPSKQNDYTGMFKGYNLIYICAESFSRMAIDKDVTPTLYKLANNGFVLNNYYNAFKNVTTNGEYAMLTGLWPNVTREDTNMGNLTGTMGRSIHKDMSIALGNMFNKTGIQSRGYHNYYGYYYGRNETLPNMGFECKFLNDGMSFTTQWPASDLEMMEQSISDYINDDQFVAYYMTFSGHGNYTEGNVMCAKNIKDVYELLGDRKMPIETARGYLACNRELDKALEYLLNELEAAGKLDNTVIVMTGDHYPYYLSDAGYELLNGAPIVDEFEKYRSTCIIYNSKMGTVKIDEPCCNVDILPTILNLFGIEYDSRIYAGTDILSDSRHVAMLYNKSFITDKCAYNSTNGNTIWFEEIPEEEKEDYIDKTYAYVKNKYTYSIGVEESDFFKYITN